MWWTFIFLCHNWKLLFHLHCLIPGNTPKIILLLGLLERTVQNRQRMQLGASTVKNNTTLTEGLTTVVSDKCLRISDNRGTGNCMFHALSEQLDTVRGIKIQHGQLRQSLVQYLRKNPKLVSWSNTQELKRLISSLGYCVYSVVWSTVFISLSVTWGVTRPCWDTSPFHTRYLWAFFQVGLTVFPLVGRVTLTVTCLLLELDNTATL